MIQQPDGVEKSISPQQMIAEYKELDQWLLGLGNLARDGTLKERTERAMRHYMTQVGRFQDEKSMIGRPRLYPFQKL